MKSKYELFERKNSTSLNYQVNSFLIFIEYITQKLETTFGGHLLNCHETIGNLKLSELKSNLSKHYLPILLFVKKISIYEMALVYLILDQIRKDVVPL